MKMESYHCHLFEVFLRIPSDAFNKDAFLEDIKDTVPDNPKFCAWTFGSQTNPGKQHADMFVDLRPQECVIAEITFHQVDKDTEDKRPPYMEDCVQWLGGFVTKAPVRARCRVLFTFNNNEFSPRANLPFPLLTVTDSSEFEDAMVTGVTIKLSGHKEIKRVSIQEESKETLLNLRISKEIGMRDFKLEMQLEELSPFTWKFIKKRE